MLESEYTFPILFSFSAQKSMTIIAFLGTTHSSELYDKFDGWITLFCNKLFTYLLILSLWMRGNLYAYWSYWFKCHVAFQWGATVVGSMLRGSNGWMDRIDRICAENIRIFVSILFHSSYLAFYCTYFLTYKMYIFSKIELFSQFLEFRAFFFQDFSNAKTLLFVQTFLRFRMHMPRLFCFGFN